MRYAAGVICFTTAIILKLEHNSDLSGHFQQKQGTSNLFDICCLNMYQNVTFTQTNLDNIADDL